MVIFPSFFQLVQNPVFPVVDGVLNALGALTQSAPVSTPASLHGKLKVEKNRLTDCRSGQWIRQALERLEIPEKINSPAGLLSVGQQQRVAIIRALCQPFDFILIDEPISHLDARNNSIVASLIEEEARANSAGVLATSVGNKINLPIETTLLL